MVTQLATYEIGHFKSIQVKILYNFQSVHNTRIFKNVVTDILVYARSVL